ncbi:flagellar biosynthesis protein FlgE [Methylobacterium sp. Leaf94]|uniref:flagellar hook protein FlgE n=1 Tax=Methylobacterium sp. Leaf94 TaxID=1736250 RepID=UPI0006F4E567|nr:flagellar hook protein FlgE [Methylobacterium sp. Leaf94]KQU30155.1 flagellar biosynthesis protein FlgE [Methylobacterium sp. Leaf94]
MSLISVLRTGVSGMNAQSNRISTVAENVQNSSTTGYKRSAAEFSSLLIDGGSTANYTSGAVETTIRRSIGTQGPVTFTSSKTDLAIQGNGFFVVQDDNKASYLTRAGNFVVDGPTGNLVNAGGFTLMGYSLVDGQAPTPALNSTDGLVPVNMASLGLRASPSTKATMGGNLAADTPTLGGTVSPTNYSKKTSLVTYDKLGNSVTLDIYLKHAPADAAATPPVLPNTWTASVYGPDQTALTAPIQFVFNADGKLSGPTTASFTIPGGEPFTLDMSGMTQLAGADALKGTANGKAPSAVTGTEFGPDGLVYATYADGTRLEAFKIPIAEVKSPDNLDPRAGNVYLPSLNSGDLQIGFAGLGGLGTLKASALEQSNVDVSTELTSMIESQTVYTANSKVFMTGNELLETLMNLKR